MSLDQIRSGLQAALVDGDASLSVADRLCTACVELLDVDGAAVSLFMDGPTRGTFGASSDLSRRLDELQFTFGEGPCVDAVSQGLPVLVADLDARTERRWPAFTGAALQAGVKAVFALPVTITSRPIGALDLFRHRSGSLSEDDLAGGLEAAELATTSFLTLLGGKDWSTVADGAFAGDQFAALERVEVYQATGMIMGQLDVGPAEALARLSAYAFAHDLTATDVAWRIVRRQLAFSPDDD